MNSTAVSATRIADAVVVIAICFGWPIVGSIWAAAAGFPTRPFDNAAFIEIIVEELILGSIALGYLRLRGHDLAALVPRPTAIGSLVGLGLYLLMTLISWPMYLFAGADALNAQPIEKMVAGSSFALPWLLAVSAVNGVFEELFLTGYLLRTLIGFGASIAIGVPVLIRALCHVYQGPLGTISVICVGIVLGAYYWRKRQLWPVVFAHIFADIAGFVLR